MALLRGSCRSGRVDNSALRSDPSVSVNCNWRTRNTPDIPLGAHGDGKPFDGDAGAGSPFPRRAAGLL